MLHDNVPHIPGFEIIREISRASHVTRYEAVQTDRGERKILVVATTDHSEVFDWFRRIDAATSRLNNPPPTIVAARLIHQSDGQLMVTESFYQGEDLVEVVRRRGPLPLTEVMRIVDTLAGALDDAHYDEVFHGGLTPKHVAIGSDGQIWLTGLGEFPPPFGIVGNLHHLAPEQFEPEPQMTRQTDVYQLAEIAIFLLSGEFAFPGPSTEWLLRKKHGPMPSVCAVRSELPAAVDRVLECALSPQPGERFTETRHFAEALRVALGLYDPTDTFGARMSTLLNPDLEHAAFEELLDDFVATCSGDAFWLSPLLPIASRLAFALKHWRSPHGRNLMEVCMYLGHPCLQALRREVTQLEPDEDHWGISLLLEACVACGGGADVCERLLDSTSSPEQRRKCAMALRYGEYECFEHVYAACDDSDPHVREAAIVICVCLLLKNNDSYDEQLQQLARVLMKATDDEPMRHGLESRWFFWNQHYLVNMYQNILRYREFPPAAQEMAASLLGHAPRYIVDKDLLQSAANFNPSIGVRNAAALSLEKLREQMNDKNQ